MKISKLVFVVAFSVACASAGHNFDVRAVDRLTPQVSTLDDATKLLGKPASESVRSDGTRVYVWMYSEASAFGSPRAKSVAIMFNAEGKMIRFNRSEINSK